MKKRQLLNENESNQELSLLASELRLQLQGMQRIKAHDLETSMVSLLSVGR